jgi:ABC-type multidrug transport system fused ATPase/permease subunit
VCFLLMILKVGWYASIAGVAVIVLMMPIQLCCSKRLSGIRRTTAAATDQRVQRTSEIFDGILAVKSAVWEDAFQSEIHTLRSTERWSIFRAMLIKAFNSGIHFATPYVATLLTFLTYWAQGNELSVSTVFSAMSLLHVLRVSIGKNLTYFIETLPEVLVSTKRLKKFLLLPEKKKKTKINKKSNATTTSSTTQEKVKIELNNLTFSWGCGSISSPHIPVVRNISLHMKPGELLVITGSTGCGKTALLKGIAGELDGEPMSGDESGDESGDGDNRIVNGSMAIVNQIPWIMSGSLKSNIVWSGTTDTNGNTNDRSDESNETNAVNDDDENFTNVLNRCGLAEDVLQWKDGVNTIIGEKGINLSGGQRARVSLARAIYADRDILLIDGKWYFLLFYQKIW